ncbi:MAG: glutamine--fructose-6-phosphate aminotransferase, partial [Propionibacteriales bacterium]|nr:glutamine--fructose-6-phosphate aminotransferase [Propionibacteriales bacterium]
MCGIVAYLGHRSAMDVVVDGLSRLEYRGYDSAGAAVVAPGSLRVEKRAGPLRNLTDALGTEPRSAAHCGVGHTRWATHGLPTDVNAHPHVDRSRRLAVVHNGIVENFAELRAGLARRGVECVSDTDTEVVANLIAEELLTDGGLADAVRRVCRRLEGAFALAAIHQDAPDVVVGARRDSPLVVGRGTAENFLASDVSAFIAHTREAIELG